MIVALVIQTGFVFAVTPGKTMEQSARKTAGRPATAPVNIAVGQRRVCFTEPAEEERRPGLGGGQLQPLNTVLAGAGDDDKVWQRI